MEQWIMKKISILIGLLSVSFLCTAQRFFYIDDHTVVGDWLNQRLVSASQYVTPQAITSDFIIKSGLSFEERSNKLFLNIQLRDSVTLETIYEAREQYPCDRRTIKQDLFVNLAVRTFLEKNIGQIILCARDSHLTNERKFLRPAKDKT
jgi:hypothetical protein